MLDSYNQEQIEKVSLELLKRAKAYGTFPTPIDKIVSKAELIVANDIDLSKVKRSFIDRITDGAKNIIKDIRGVLDRRRKVIYVDMSVGESRQSFIKLHETGHEVIPWQQEIISCLDDDYTLSPEVKEEFEAEANFFASHTLFQGDLFDDEMKRLPLGLRAAKALAKKFGGSIHATLRKMVEKSKKRCALLVLEKPAYFPGLTCKVRNYFQSKSFTSNFGELMWDEELSMEHGFSFMEMCYLRKKYSEDGELTIVTPNGSINLKYHYFNNTHNIFVLLFPDGEDKATRTKIILTGSEKIR
jgi:Zn-dependent peptidase ImmA (M78 family)